MMQNAMMDPDDDDEHTPGWFRLGVLSCLVALLLIGGAMFLLRVLSGM